MSTIPISIRSLLMTALCFLGAGALTAAQTPSIPQTAPGNGYRIAGTIVSKTDGHPLARARITLRDAKNPQKFDSIVTAENGKFEFNGLPAGKYDLHGAKRGYISASYDQHDQFSTAIVTGVGLETEALVLRLAPAAIISGKILDEAGEPVRHASVTLYYDDHTSGVDQIRQVRGASTDDQGAYEIAELTPGTYFLSASGSPWYALHPTFVSDSVAGQSPHTAGPVAVSVDRSLDVAYPVTYYPDVTEADSATPIPIRGGERLQVEIHLNPVPSLHLLLRVPNNKQYSPTLEQPAFDGSTSVANLGMSSVWSSGLVEVAGIPAGRYNLRLYGQGPAIQMNGIDLSKNGEEIDASSGEALSTVKVTLRAIGETSLPPQLWVGLRGAHRAFAGRQQVNAKGEVEFQQVPPERYELWSWLPDKPYSIAHISAEGAEVSGHSITVTAGSSPSVSLTVVGGSLNVEGTAKRAGKPFAGAMVVLVPKNPEENRDLFRRDQSDLDGTFNLRNVVPGSYTVLAIENGWDLDWSQPAVIAAYTKRGRTLEVDNHFGRPESLSDPIEVQSR